MANMENKKIPNPKKGDTPKRAKPEPTDNAHQKTVSGKNQRGPSDKVGKSGGEQATRKGGRASSSSQR